MRKDRSISRLRAMNRTALVPVLAAAAVAALLNPSRAYALDDGAVVASIKPVHSLVAAVMEGVGTPHLIVRGGASPHTYSLRPSDARSLQNAKAVFWIGSDLETFLAKPIESLGQDAKLVTLSETHDLTKLEFREGGPFEGHDHGAGHDHEEAHEHEDEHHEEHAHDEHDHDEHGHDEHDHDAENAGDKKQEHAAEHEHADADEHEHEHTEEHDHAAEQAHKDEHGHAHEEDHSRVDMHLWLDPQNAKAMLHEIEETLVALDPENAAVYEANAQNYAKRIDALSQEIEADLAPVRAKSFIVFHDAYQYFEKRFGVTASGSITVNPDVIPGAQRIAEIQGRVKELGDTCVFAEPQFEPKLVKVVTEGTNARSGVLDPLGTELDGDGPELYLDLIRAMASSIKTCLSGTL